MPYSYVNPDEFDKITGEYEEKENDTPYKKIPPATPEKTEGRWYKHSCGQTVSDSYLFCPNCKQKL